MAAAFQFMTAAPYRMERVVAYKPGVIHSDMGQCALLTTNALAHGNVITATRYALYCMYGVSITDRCHGNFTVILTMRQWAELPDHTNPHSLDA